MQHNQATAMTGEDDEAPPRFTWVRCPGCGNGLWRAYADRIEMPLTLRGGQKRVITVSPEGIHVLKVRCEKCSVVWSGDDQATLRREDGTP